jgi:hypothetical protein
MVIQDKEARYRAIRLFGAKALFKGKNVVGLTFTDNYADLNTKGCYILESMEELKWGPRELKLTKKDDFDWYTPIVFLRSGKILAVKTKELLLTGEELGATLQFEVYAEEYELPVKMQSLNTTVIVRDYNLSNLLLRYPKSVSGGICQYDKLVEIFEDTLKTVELINPRIEVKDSEEERIQLNPEEMEQQYGIGRRIADSVFGRKE